MIFKIFAIKNLSSWNIIDIFRLLLFIAYSIDKLSNSPFKIEYLLIFIVLLSCLQGLQYFSIFTHTRLIAKKIINGIIKVISCGSVIIYVLGSLACILFISDYELEKDDSKWKSLDGAYISTISLIMLCLLISLSVDKYNEYQDVKELANIVCTQEKILIWKRNKNLIKYFQQCIQSTWVKYNNEEKLFNKGKSWKWSNVEINSKLDSIDSQFQRIEDLVKRIS